VYIFRPYPTSFNKLGGVIEPVQATLERAVVYIVTVKRIVALAGMPQSVVVIVLIRTLIKTKGVGHHPKLTVYSTSNSLE
jgi:hypothetical protein